jgi:hypothetical protein
MYKKNFTIQISSDIKVDEITCNKLKYKHSGVCHVSPVTILGINWREDNSVFMYPCLLHKELTIF